MGNPDSAGPGAAAVPALLARRGLAASSVGAECLALGRSSQAPYDPQMGIQRGKSWDTIGYSSWVFNNGYSTFGINICTIQHQPWDFRRIHAFCWGFVWTFGTLLGRNLGISYLFWGRFCVGRCLGTVCFFSDFDFWWIVVRESSVCGFIGAWILSKKLARNTARPCNDNGTAGQTMIPDQSTIFFTFWTYSLNKHGQEWTPHVQVAATDRSHQALSQLANADDREKWLQLRLTLAAVCRSSWICVFLQFLGDVDHLQTDHYP